MKKKFFLEKINRLRYTIQNKTNIEKVFLKHCKFLYFKIFLQILKIIVLHLFMNKLAKVTQKNIIIIPFKKEILKKIR